MKEIVRTKHIKQNKLCEIISQSLQINFQFLLFGISNFISYNIWNNQFHSKVLFDIQKLAQ